ncbi:polysaccharide biosynthesis protein [Eionea flava]
MKKTVFNSFVHALSVLSRTSKRFIMVSMDLVALCFALWSSFALRLSEWWPEEYLIPSTGLFFVTPVVGVYIFMRLGLYRAVVRFMGTQAIWAVVKGVMLLALFLWSAVTVLQITPFPRSIPINFALVALIYVGGSRFLVRYFYHWFMQHHIDKEAVLIYGAGGAGIQLATALTDGREYYPVGFIDDDKNLWKSTIKGLPVYSIESLSEVIERENVKHVLLAVPHVSNKQRKRMLESLSGLSVHVQTIPSMPELLEDNDSITQLREIEVEELLGRDPVPAESSLMSKCISGKVVMVTGAGGSIGSELCRQVFSQSPKALVLFELNEYGLYKIEQELAECAKASGGVVPVYALLGSVANRKRVKQVIAHFSVDTVYHAAAYKHVPIVEHNIIEGVFNNAMGTRIMAEESSSAGVQNFILVSTDKAVRPTNIMGASKRFAEIILQVLADKTEKTTFSIVRFGNVLGSSGSVVPLFREQIRQGGPITVTHPEITRYFMTIPEAASLVIQAGSMAEDCDVFVLDMGEPVKIIDLAKRMVQLSGLEVKTDQNNEGDIEIICTGLRPAEKLYEELLVSEDVIGTDHPKIMRANENSLDSKELEFAISHLDKALQENDFEQIRTIFSRVVLGYQPHKKIVDHMTTSSLSSDNVVPITKA